MFDALRAKVEDRRRRLAELERERSVVEIELRTYEDALAIVQAAVPAPVRAFTIHNPNPTEPRRRKVAANWTATLRSFATPPFPLFDIDEVLRAAADVGFETTRSNVRSQMHALVSRGRVERVSDGVFRLTSEGAREIGGEGLTEGTVADETAADTLEEPAAA